MTLYERRFSVLLSQVFSVIALSFALTATVHAQDIPQVPTPPVSPDAPKTPGTVPIPDLGPQTQPNAPTPSTPLPKEIPDTNKVGIKKDDIKETTRFDMKGKTPGQPQEGDPNTIRTLDQALEVAYARNPSILIAFERAVKTNATIAQILGARGPQISGGLTYSRLLNGQSGLGGASAGVSPAQITNPFAVGLTNTPPGSAPVSLSGSSGTGAGAGTGSQGAAATTTSGQSTGNGGTTRSAKPLEGTRQQTGDPDGDGGTEQDDPDTGTGTGTGNQNTGLFGSGTNLNQAAARITISQFIDITGILRTAQQVGGLEQALTRLEIARLRQETALNVKNGYYNVLRAQAFVQVNEAAVAQSEEQLRVTRAQQTAGVASAFDVLRAQTQLDNNRQALIQSRNQLLITKNAFAGSLGIDPSTPVDLEDITAVPTLPSLDETALITTAIDQRPEYYQADTNILKAGKNIRLARRNLEPYLNAVATGAYNLTQPAFGSNRDTGSIGLALTVPLWDGGATREAIKAARSDERQSLIQKDQFVRGIKSEVQQAILAVKDAYERQTTTEGTVTQAREALRLANVRFKAGVGTQLEINDAQTALTQAETNQVNARYDYLAAIARLNRAIGTPQ